MATVNGHAGGSDFGNPWERMSDQENSDGAEDVCTCRMSDSDHVQRNLVGQMLLREREEESAAAAVVREQPVEIEEANPKGDKPSSEPRPYRTELSPFPIYDVPDTHIGLAWLVTLCFNIPLGIVAICMSMKAAKSYVEGNRKQGRRYTKLSLYSSLAGIVLTVVIVMSVILYLAVKEAADRRKRLQG